MKLFEYSISITGKDQPGIIAAVTKLLFEIGGNLEDATMTILRGQFSMILLVSFKQIMSNELFAKTARALEREKQISIHANRITSSESSLRKVTRTEPYLISIFGKDKAGIVYRVSSLLAKYQLNITDLDSKLIGSKSRLVYALLIEVDIPASFKVQKLRAQLNRIADKLKVDVQIKPVDTTTF